MTARSSRTPGSEDAASDRPRRRGPRWVGWLLRALLILIALIAIAWVALQQQPISTALARAVFARIHVVPRSMLSARQVQGDWLTHLELRGIRIARGDTLLAAVDTLRVRYGLGALLAGQLHVRELTLAGVTITQDIVDTTKTSPKKPKPPLTLADVLRGRFYPGPPLRVDRLSLRDARYGGRFGAPDSGAVLTHVGLEARRVRLGRGFSFQLDTLAARGHTAREPRAELALGVGAELDRGRFDFRGLHFQSDSSAIDGRALLSLDRRDSLAEARIELHARPWALRDLAELVPGLAVEGAVTADLDLRGPRADRMSGTVAATTEYVRWGTFELGATRLDATLVDGRSDTKVATIYGGARTEIDGWLRPFDRTPTYDLEARTNRLPDQIAGLAWWPSFAARAQSNVTLRAHGSGFARPLADVTGHTRGDAGDLDLEGRIDFTNGFAWSVRRLAFDRLDVARLMGDTTGSTLSGTLTGGGEQRAGRSPSRRLAAELTLGPSSYGDWRVRNGRMRARMNGSNAGASLTLDTEAGSIAIDSLVGRWDRTGAFRLVGARFSDLDLERWTRQPALASRLTGSVSGQVRGVTALAGRGAAQALREGRVSGDLQVDLEPSRFRAQEITRGAVRVRLVDGTANVTGTIESPTGAIDLLAHARPFDAPASYELDRGRFTNLDLSGWTGAPSLRSRLTGSVTARARGGQGAGSAGTWEGEMRLDPSTLANLTLEGGQARGSWSGDHGQLVADVRAGGDTLSVRSEIAMQDRTPTGRADLVVPFGVVTALRGRDSLKTSGRLLANASFTGLNPGTATMDGTIRGSGSVGRARLDSLFAGFHLRRGSLVLDTLLTGSNLGTASGSGHLALFDTSASTPSEMRLNLLVYDLSPLRSLVHVDTMAVDTARLAVHIQGVGRARTFEVTGLARSFAWNDLRLLRADGSATGELDAGWRPARARIIASLRRLRGVGPPVSEAHGRVELVDDTTVFDVTGNRDERHQLHLVGRLHADSLGRHIALERLDVQSDSAAWALTHPTHIDIRPDRLAIDEFELRSANGRIDAHGVIDRRGQQDFRLDVRDVQLDILSAWLGRENVFGTLSGNLALDGPAAAPRGSGNLQLDLVVDGRPSGAVRSRAVWKGEELEFGGEFASPQNDSLTWVGTLPLNVSLAIADTAAGAAKVRVLEGDVDVRLRAQKFPLEAFSPFLDPHSVGGLDGTLDLDARLRGSSRKVVGQGRIDVRGGVVALPGLGVVYRNLEVHGQFRDNRLVLDQTHATSEKGSLDASGDFRFIGVTRIEPHLHVDTKRFVFVQTPDLRAIATMSIDVTGTVTSPIVKGKASIENSSYTLVPTTTTATSTDETGSTVRLTDADLRMLEENFGDVQATATTNAGLQLYDASDLDLAISLARNNWVRQRVQPKMSVALTGDFRFRKPPHRDPELTGRIAPIPGRGYVEQFARSFDIAGGEVLLNGPMTEHHVDIQAQYKPPSTTGTDDEDETVIKLDVQGTIEKMNLTLSSEPPMSEVEIVNYIATGKSADKSSSSASDASLAKDIGLSQVTGFAEEAAQEAIGLDVLQVRFDALQGATLVAGRFVDPQLYVGFRQPLQYKESNSPSSSVQTTTSVELEYAIYQWLLLNLQGETSKVRSFIRARHAY